MLAQAPVFAGLCWDIAKAGADNAWKFVVEINHFSRNTSTLYNFEHLLAFFIF